MASRIFWTRQAREDLRQIRAFIARDAPLTATAFVQRLRESVDHLREFPKSGQVVPELGREQIREVLRGIIESSIASAMTAWKSSQCTMAHDFSMKMTSD